MCGSVCRFTLLSSALVVGGAVGWALTNRVEGSGHAGTEDRDIGEVTEVTLSGVGDLTVIRRETPGLTVTADDNILPHLETKTSGGKLTLRSKSGITPKTPIAYTLFVPSLNQLAVSGAGNATADGLAGENLVVKVSGAGGVELTGLAYHAVRLDLSGAGNAKLGGLVAKFTAKISGAGDVTASDLKATLADVTISGAGHASVWAIDDLKVRVSGAGDVRYKGNPRVERRVSGAGSVTSLASR